MITGVSTDAANVMGMRVVVNWVLSLLPADEFTYLDLSMVPSLRRPRMEDGSDLSGTEVLVPRSDYT